MPLHCKRDRFKDLLQKKTELWFAGVNYFEWFSTIFVAGINFFAKLGSFYIWGKYFYKRLKIIGKTEIIIWFYISVSNFVFFEYFSYPQFFKRVLRMKIFVS